MYIKRDIEDYIRSASSSFQAIVIYGPRQVGKSTTVDMIFGDKFKSVTLDDTNECELALSNPKGFLEVHPWPIIINEVQKAPNLLSEIKIIIDEQRKIWLKEDKKRELMFVLTGSNQFELQYSISESLAGRAAVFNMFSMTQLESQKINGNLFNPDIKELLKRTNNASVSYKTKSELFDYIFRGGMPDVVVGNSERELYFKSYFDTYIEKDVLKLIAASSEMQFRSFII